MSKNVKAASSRWFTNADKTVGRRDILSQKANISNMDFCNFNPLNSRPLRPTICLLNTARLPCKKTLFPALAARLGILHHVNIFTSCACAERRTPLCRLQPCSCTPDRMEPMIVDLRGIYSSARPATDFSAAAEAEPSQPNYSPGSTGTLALTSSFLFAEQKREKTRTK